MSRSSRPARLLVLPLLASALALAGPLPAASAAPAAPTADPAFLPELVVPGQPLPQPRTEELLGAGTQGFLHSTRDDRYAWTRYDTGVTTYVSEFSSAYNFNTATWHGTSSDLIIKSVPRMDSLDWVLQDSAAGTTATVNSPRTDSPAGVYGDALLTQTLVPESPGSSSLKISGLTFRRADASGATVSVPVTGWPDASGAPGRIRFLGGDAKEAALGFNDAAGQFRIALADTHTGALRVSPPEHATDPAVSSCPGASAVGTDRIAWIANDCNAHVLSRADLSATETMVPFGATNKPEALGLTGDWLLSVAHQDGGTNSPTPGQKELKASLLTSSGTAVTLLSHASTTMVQAPDGSVVIEGGENSSDWRVRRVTGVGGAPASVATTGYRVEPDAYTIVTESLSENVLTTAESGSTVDQGFAQRQVTLGAAPAVGARTSIGTDLYPDPSQLCMAGSNRCNTMVGTGDGRVIHPGTRGTGLIVRQGRNAKAVPLPQGLPAANLTEASGRYVLVNTSTYQHPGQVVLDLDAPTPGTQVAATSSYVATVDAGTLYSPGANPGEITALDLATQQSRTVQTGKACPVTNLESSRGWLYWNCGTQRLAGVLRPATGTAIDVASGAAAMGDGFLLYTDTNSYSQVVDFHTGTPVTSNIKTNLRSDGLWGPWSVDRFGSGLVYTDQLSNIHLISVTAPAQGTTFTSVSPDRLLDTRYAIGQPTTDKVPGRATVNLQVAGRSGVPLGAKAVVLNVTATETDGGGHLTAWASGSQQPTSSNLNWTAPGVTTPNLVVVPLGPDGKVNLFNGSWNTTHLIADVFGYYTDSLSGSTYTAVSPDRLLDTRYAIGQPTTDKVPGRATVNLQVTG
ncbi:hypothetical protein ACIRYZ_38355, partial [Kitasatospora sp. NPDC101155]|uniref:hypothetical protein n=1 Tax=Kitasatospora sp. NPDC101155 TaxID=3364097 RepID=UPI003821F0CF